MPQTQMTEAADCTEMAEHGAQQSDVRGASDTGNPCENMTLGCIVAMGCIAPLVLSEPFAGDPAVAIKGATFAAALAKKLRGPPIEPEFPPPQTIRAA